MAKDTMPAEGTSETETTPPVADSTESVNGPQEGQDAPQGQPGADADGFGGDAPAPADTYQEVKPQNAGRDQTDAEAAGFHGALAEPADGDPNAIQAADKAAPGDDVENTEHPEGFHSPDGLPATTKDTKDTKAVPLNELPGYPRSLTQTPESRVGFVGDVPTSASEREAMTLKAQADVARDQYGDGKSEPVTTT